MDWNIFVHIADCIYSCTTEMGKLSAHYELGANMDQVKILQGEGNKEYGDQNTDGSSSVRGVYTKMRSVAAVARMMLITASD